jgi:hypothetical protein
MNLVDYFAVCGLDVKSGLEPEPQDDSSGNMSDKLKYLRIFEDFFILKLKRIRDAELRLKFLTDARFSTTFRQTCHGINSTRTLWFK